jgi:hypothetical protein
MFVFVELVLGCILSDFSMEFGNKLQFADHLLSHKGQFTIIIKSMHQWVNAH